MSLKVVYAQYFLFFLMGLFIGRITMAIQYAIFKEMAYAKKKKVESQVNSPAVSQTAN